MQDILDRKYPPIDDDSDDEDREDSEDEEPVPARENSNYTKAEEELLLFESWKRKKYRPTFDASKSRILAGVDDDGKKHEILVGPVLSRGKDLPSGENLADYIDCRGRIHLVRFFLDHIKYFPTLWIVVQCECSRRQVEVGCERFFSLSGYVSAPRRTRLGVRTYERLAMMASILQKVYIDKEWVAKEYLQRCKKGAWKKENTEEALKCWNLERIIDADLMGDSQPLELTIDQLINEGEVDASASSTRTSTSKRKEVQEVVEVVDVDV